MTALLQLNPGNKSRILEFVHSIQANAREVRMLVETEEANFDQDREWPLEKNFIGDDCWQWLCGDEDEYGSLVKSANGVIGSDGRYWPKVTDNE